jgi:tRNA (guanosine-2'-O-)-methyltransferase
MDSSVHLHNISPVTQRRPERVEKISNMLQKRQPDLTIVLENVHDPHNVSAVLRSCDAVGVAEVHLLYHSGQSFPRLGEKSSASARKWVLSRPYHSVDSCYEVLRKQGKKIWTTAIGEQSVSLYDMDFTQPIALVFGNEHAGVSQECIDKADGNFIIPQVGMIQSLNISVACAVSLYEAFRQRNNAGFYDQVQYAPDQFQDKLNHFCSNP